MLEAGVRVGAVDEFLASEQVQRIMRDLAFRIHESGAGRVQVAKLLPLATIFGHLVATHLIRLGDDAERTAFTEAAWRHFRGLALRLCPVAQWPSGRLGPIDEAWAWIAFDHRGAAIRIDDSGAPYLSRLKPRGLNLKKLEKARTCSGRGSKQAHSARARGGPGDNLRDISLAKTGNDGE